MKSEAELDQGSDIDAARRYESEFQGTVVQYTERLFFRLFFKLFKPTEFS